MKLSDIRSLANLDPFTGTQDQEKRRLEQLKALGYDPGSIYQELEMTSRYVDTHRDVSFHSGDVHLHSHNFYEVLYCRTTCGAEYLVGTERYRLQKGDIIFISPGVSHRPLLPEYLPEPYDRDVLWFSAEFAEILLTMMSKAFHGYTRRSSLLRTAGTRWEYLGEHFHNGVLEAEAGAPGWEAAVIGNTLLLLTHMARAFFDKSSVSLSAEHPELLDRAMAYIEDNLSKKITLADVAHQLYVSESTISQTFRNKMGVSFHHCLTQRRLIAAKQLIQENLLLEDVGQAVGFPDYSTFYRAFKKEYGICPRQYRKLYSDPAAAE